MCTGPRPSLGRTLRSASMQPRWVVHGDIDGFFGLFIDNLLQLMLIAGLGKVVCGFPPELITGRILPGAAVSILLGNLFYAWQARELMKKTGREDVTRSEERRVGKECRSRW